MICLYFHINPETKDPFYIGIGNKERPYSKSDRNKWWHNTVNKNGLEIKIIQEGLTWGEACEKEIYFIQKFGRRDIGTGILVNMTDGGDGMKNLSLESRIKMSKKAKRRKGDKNSMYGKTFNHSEEAIKKIRESSLGRKHSTKTIAKISGKNNGMWGKTFNHTKETKNKISLAAKGNNQEISKCPYCNKLGKGSAMYRWHFDQCKNKNI